jgi:hypothetical protein
VFFEQPGYVPPGNYTLAAALADAAPRLCPAWEAAGGAGGLPVFITREEQRAVIDWNGEHQLILEKSGAAVFNYGRRRTGGHAAMMAVSGAEAGLESAALVARVEDGGQRSGGLIDSAELHQLGGSGLFRARIRFLKPAAEVAAAGAILSVTFDEPGIAATHVLLTAKGAQAHARMAGEAGTYASASRVRAAGQEVEFAVPAFDEPVDLPGLRITFAVETGGAKHALTAFAPVRVERRLRFEAAGREGGSDLPLVYDSGDGALIPGAVRDAAKELAGPGWDALAIYSSQAQDLGGAAAYAARRMACENLDCRHESLLAMNSIRRVPLDYDNPATYQTLNHEFAHNWLFSVLADEFGQMTKILNPISPHPAAYVHTASANPVFEIPAGEAPWESSTMGGAWWVHEGFGVHRTGTSAKRPGFGYSWLDLWLMGLAGDEEVPPFFYVLELVPTLPREYWPLMPGTVQGVHMELGTARVRRDPEYLTAPPIRPGQELYVPFVLVEERGRPDPEGVVLGQLLASNWPRHWEAAVLGRASLRTRPRAEGGTAAAMLVAAAGSGQAIAGEGEPRLRKPFVVKAVDGEGRAVAGVEIRWKVAEGEGWLSKESSVTGPDGLAYVHAALKSSVLVVEASAEGLEAAARFEARLAPVTARVVSGAHQTWLTGETLPMVVIVEYRDQRGQPVAGFEVRAAGSNASTPEPVYATDSEGRIAFPVTLGRRAGEAYVILTPAGTQGEAGDWVEDLVIGFTAG